MVQKLLKLSNTKFTIPILLGMIFLASFGIRIINQGNIPGLTWDEAALGYNAYSIMQTGKDEYGEFLPLIFKSFGDYKPGVYIYLSIPFIFLFGLTEVGVRMLSIVVGSLIPVIGFLITRKIVVESKNTIGLIVALMLSISVWGIHFSSSAWETNLSYFFVLLGIFLFIKGLEKYYYLYPSMVLFCLSIFTYQSAKMFVTLLVMGLFILFARELFKGKNRIKSILLILSIFITLGLSILDSEARSRLVVLNQYGYQRSEQEIGEIKSQEINNNDYLFTLFHSHQLEYLRTVIGRYINYYSPKFLFVNGPTDGRQGVLDYGMMHLFELPFLVAGVIYLIRQRRYKYTSVIFLWILIAPIPSALSRDVVSTVRALPLSFGLEFVTGIGIYYLFSVIRSIYWRVGLGVLLILVVGISLGIYFDKAVIHSRIHASTYWLYGHKQAVEFVMQHQTEYEKVVFTSGYGQPYIFYLFYTKYDPATYQKQANLMVRGVDVGNVERLDKVEFRPIFWPDDRGKKNRLYIGKWIELPEQDIDPKEANLLQTIYFLDKETAFRIVETKK